MTAPQLYRWRWRARLPERFGQLLRVTARGELNSCRIEFVTDGVKVITSRNALEKVPMKTIEEYCAIIGWTLRGLSERLNCNDRTVRRWADGSNPVPESILKWLARLAAAHEKYPAPDGWRTKSAGLVEAADD